MDSDQEILAKIAAGRDVLAEIVGEMARRYGDDLLQFCGWILRTYPRQRLEDIVQEVFLAVYLSIQRYDISRGAEGIQPWLRGIAQNKCVEELRQHERRTSATSDFSELEQSNLSAHEKVERPLQSILAKRAFTELSTENQLMVATRLMGWFSRKEMADMFGYDDLQSYDRQMLRIHQTMRKFVEGKRDDVSK